MCICFFGCSKDNLDSYQEELQTHEIDETLKSEEGLIENESS